MEGLLILIILFILYILISQAKKQIKKYSKIDPKTEIKPNREFNKYFVYFTTISADYEGNQTIFKNQKRLPLNLLPEYVFETTEKFSRYEKEMSERYEKFVIGIIEKYKFNLLAERKKLITLDSYGVPQDNGWNKSKGKKETGIDYFEINVLFPALEDEFKNDEYPRSAYRGREDGWESFYDASEWATFCFCEKKLGFFDDSQGRVEEWRNNLINQKLDEIENKNSHSQDTSLMSGIEYENYCKNILEESGWEVEDTPTSGDQGVDLIASIEDVRGCIQCKCFAKAVGNKAVQEVAAGMIHWKGTHSVVVARNGFTKSAKTLAESNKVILTSDNELADLENLVL